MSFIDHSVAEGFIRKHLRDALVVSDSPATLLDLLAVQEPPASLLAQKKAELGGAALPPPLP